MHKSRKMLAAFLVLAATLILSAAVAFAEGTDYKGTINGTTVNLRVKPDTSSKILTQLSKGTVVAVSEIGDNWCKVTADGVTGWISKQFVVISEAVAGKGTIKGNNVNVRSKASASSEKIAQLDNGTKINIIKKSGSWYRIALGDGKYGWVSSEFVVYRDSSTSRGSDESIVAAVNSDESADTVADESASADSGDLRQNIVAYARKFLGVKYVYGGSSPKGFDCSGFVQYVMKHFDIKVDRSSDDQALNGKKISKSELKPGDMVFFDTNGGHNAIEHAGIYIGDGNFIHASSGSAHKVTISNLNEGFYERSYMWARRVIND